MEDETREKPKFANDEREDVEGHKFEPSDGEQERPKFANDESDDVEGHKF